MKRWPTWVVVGLLAAVLVLIGLLAGRFVQYLTMRVMLLGIFALGYNLLLGRTGLLSFGHGAFYAAGGYGLGLLQQYQISSDPVLGILAGLAVAAILALIIGFFCVRHTAIYFAMLTLAFGMMVFSLLWNLRFTIPGGQVVGGDDGLVGIVRGSINLLVVHLPLAKDHQLYWLVLFCFALTIFVIHRIRSSSFGLVLAGIRENEQRTKFAGASVTQYRLAVFVISALFAALAGSLHTMLSANTDVGWARWDFSAEPVLVSLIGGLQTFAGPLVGSAIFFVSQEITQRFPEVWMLSWGIILLIVIMGFRGGVMGGLEKFWARRWSVKPSGGDS
jgi:branched-chain amino acid transport system permease protein